MTEQERYTAVSFSLAQQLTLQYSSSFSLASKLFQHSIRHHIYAVYGMVRVADEIVDTFGGNDIDAQLSAFQSDVHQALASGYSTNPIIHAFAQTARLYRITPDIIDPFFDSMRTDLTATAFTQKDYETYIYGSAEVVGLMCLKVFCEGDQSRYDELVPGARHLGKAYQKINFLRDFAADYHERGRVYFPGVVYETFSDEQKRHVEKDIAVDLSGARSALRALPRSARLSVFVSYLYYTALFKRLRKAQVAQVKAHRAHVPAVVKLALFLYAPIGIYRL